MTRLSYQDYNQKKDALDSKIAKHVAEKLQHSLNYSKDYQLSIAGTDNVWNLTFNFTEILTKSLIKPWMKKSINSLEIILVVYNMIVIFR